MIRRHDHDLITRQTEETGSANLISLMIASLRLAAVLAATTAALGCVAATPHVGLTSYSDDDFPCPFVAAPGYLEGGGGDSQVVQDDDDDYMGCGDGPLILLEHVDGDTATFSLRGARVRVREGATERLGPYRVHVIEVRGKRVKLELSDPG